MEKGLLARKLPVFLIVGIFAMLFAQARVIPGHSDARWLATPEINVRGYNQNIASGSTTTSTANHTDFGSVSIESGETTVVYTIQNTGGAALSVSGVTINGPGASAFSVTQLPAASIAASGFSIFKVTFNPASLGQKNAIISIANNDADENPYTFAITGLGVQTYADTDGDGITDNIDIDDDNDGIPDIYEQINCYQSTSSNLVEYVFLNETFGTGTTKGKININIPDATCTYCYEDGIAGTNTPECPSQSSWILDDGEYVVTHRIAGTTAGDPDNIHGDLAWNGLEDHTPGDVNGRMAVFNASYTPGIFYETTIRGIVPNVPITYSFWALNIMSKHNYNGSIKPNITVDFLTLDGVVLSTFNTGDIGRCNAGNNNNDCTLSEWREYTTSVNLGTHTSFVIRFKNNAPGGGGNDLALDDISIKQQYCDRDNDNIPNIFDLDADNDGIPDIVEAGFGFLANGKSHMDMDTPGLWVDENQNGMHDFIDAMLANGTYQLPDTDGDGTADFQDLDSDNDGVFDVDEAGLYNGDGDINGDGLGDGADSDRDGILDAFDDFTGFGTTAKTDPADSDGDGVPDYLQLDSDSDGYFDIQHTLYAGLDADNDGKIDDDTDIDRDGISDLLDSDTMALGSPRHLDRKLFVEFDGRNDYMLGPQMVSGLSSATLMGWIKTGNGTHQNATLFGEPGFALELTANGTLSARANGQSVSHNAALQPDRWYHIGAVFNSGEQRLSLYLNGRELKSVAHAALAASIQGSGPFTGAKHPGVAGGYFFGGIDELRIFNTALTSAQYQKMVYQELEYTGGNLRGTFIPKNIPEITASALIGYYRMDTYRDDVLDNLALTGADAGNSPDFMRIYNVKQIRPQLAPMPFVTAQAGGIEEAVSQQNFVHGPDAVEYPWAILDIRHDIDFEFNQTTLGAKIHPGVEVSVSNNSKFENSWYLKLDGRMDLQEKAQLVQTEDSDLDPMSIGTIERDQQGSPNKFNYNYWTSPVGTSNGTTNNNSFSVTQVMFDGTDASNPQPFQWTSALNSIATTPLTMSGYWIFKFQNLSNSYSNWATVGPNGTLSAAEGFTLKGSNAPLESQNYVFIGKPNNGPMSLPIAAGNLNLTGNPYASALDAHAFIEDNLTSTSGALYFWEHYSTNATHVTQNYQGGYAVRTLVGGTPPVAPPGISGDGSSLKVPGRFIPVGQGFFVNGSNQGGQIVFGNHQRAFIREDNANSNPVFRTSAYGTASADENATIEQVSIYSNREDEIQTAAHPIIRLGYDYTNGFHRQLLLGFMGDKANSGFNPGYDAVAFDTNPDDLTFMLGARRVVIMGEGHFNVEASYPLEAKSATNGQVRFSLQGTEHFPQGQAIYIYDALDGSYNDLRESAYETVVNAGVTANRFFLRFQSEMLGTNAHSLERDLVLVQDNLSDMLAIVSTNPELEIQRVSLINMLGQTLVSRKNASTRFELETSGFAAGTYIARIETASGTKNIKFIIE